MKNGADTPNPLHAIPIEESGSKTVVPRPNTSEVCNVPEVSPDAKSVHYPDGLPTGTETNLHTLSPKGDPLGMTMPKPDDQTADRITQASPLDLEESARQELVERLVRVKQDLSRYAVAYEAGRAECVGKATKDEMEEKVRVMKELQARLVTDEEVEDPPWDESVQHVSNDLDWKVVNEQLLLVSSAANIRRKEILNAARTLPQGAEDPQRVMDLERTKELIDDAMAKDPRKMQSKNKHIHSVERWANAGMWEEIVKEGEDASEKVTEAVRLLHIPDRPTTNQVDPTPPPG